MPIAMMGPSSLVVILVSLFYLSIVVVFLTCCIITVIKLSKIEKTHSQINETLKRLLERDEKKNNE